MAREAVDMDAVQRIRHEGLENSHMEELAGYLTRCEAYLDSKGFLRWWSQDDAQGGVPAIGEEACVDRV